MLSAVVVEAESLLLLPLEDVVAVDEDVDGFRCARLRDICLGIITEGA